MRFPSRHSARPPVHPSSSHPHDARSMIIERFRRTPRVRDNGFYVNGYTNLLFFLRFIFRMPRASTHVILRRKKRISLGLTDSGIAMVFFFFIYFLFSRRYARLRLYFIFAVNFFGAPTVFCRQISYGFRARKWTAREKEATLKKKSRRKQFGGLGRSPGRMARYFSLLFWL